jgi:hypothetical protein
MHTRSIRCICSLAAIGFLWLLATHATASAASILNLELIPDGSAEPPGDRLEFVPLLAPDEHEATCEIRAYVVSADHKQTQAVQSTGQHDRGADGKFLISRVVKQNKGEHCRSVW